MQHGSNGAWLLRRMGAKHGGIQWDFNGDFMVMLWWFNGDLIWFYGDLMGFYWIQLDIPASHVGGHQRLPHFCWAKVLETGATKGPISMASTAIDCFSENSCGWSWLPFKNLGHIFSITKFPESPLKSSTSFKIPWKSMKFRHFYGNSRRQRNVSLPKSARQGRATGLGHSPVLRDVGNIGIYPNYPSVN